MSKSTSRKFTRAGFPKPNKENEYNQDEVVWVYIAPNLPLWPAQIKTGGTLFSVKKQSTTKNMSKIQIATFNDPDLSVAQLNEDDIINGKPQKKPRKSKQDLSKKRWVVRSKLLEWDALNKEGKPINFQHVLDAYVKRKKLKDVDAIDDNIYKQWDIAAFAGDEEAKRLKDLKKLNKLRKEEDAARLAADKDEKRKENSMKGEIYDGRILNKKTRRLEGWELNAGDRIRYWPTQTIGNEPLFLTTTIIRIYNKYETLKASDHVPMDVEHSGNPPMMDTPIEKILPDMDDMNAIFYPLSQCKFNPSQIRNETERAHNKQRRQYARECDRNGWRGLLYNNKEIYQDSDSDSDCDMEDVKKKKQIKKKNSVKSKNKKCKRKRKRRLSDDDDDDCEMNENTGTDSDIQILNDKKNKNKKMKFNNIVNGEDSLKLTFENKNKRRVRKQKTNNNTNNNNTNNKNNNNMEPRKKKRRLNNPKQSVVMNTTTNKKNKKNKKVEYINISSGECEDNDNNNTNNKNTNNDCEMSDSNSNNRQAIIPFPQRTNSKKKKKKTKSVKQNKNQRKKANTLDDLGGMRIPKKRQLRPVRDETPIPRSFREGVFVNYVNEYCCPQYYSSLHNHTRQIMHDEFCLDRYCSDNSNIFVICNGSFYSNNNAPHNLNCTSMITYTSASSASKQIPSVYSSHSSYCGKKPNQMTPTSNKKKKNKKSNKNKKNKNGRMSSLASLRNNESTKSPNGLVQQLDKMIDESDTNNSNKSKNKNKSNKNSKQTRKKIENKNKNKDKTNRNSKQKIQQKDKEDKQEVDGLSNQAQNDIAELLSFVHTFV